MPFQLRDLRFKPMLLLVPIIVLGLIAGGEAVISCYKCNGGPTCDDPPRDFAHSVWCQPPFHGCFKSGVPGAFKRYCYPFSKARCIMRILDEEYGESENCYHAAVHSRLNPRIERCIKDGGINDDEEIVLPTAANGTVCVCNFESFCNAGPVELHDYRNGTTEAPIPTLNCYSCEGVSKKCTMTKYCHKGEYCAEATGFDGKVTKWCLARREAQCMMDDEVTSPKHMYKGKDGLCWDSKSVEETKDIFSKVENCASSRRGWKLGRPKKKILHNLKKMCICNDKNLCNGKLTPAGQAISNSNSKFIFGILTLITIWNYGTGITAF